MPSFAAFAGVDSAPSSAPLDPTETLLLRGGILEMCEVTQRDEMPQQASGYAKAMMEVQIMAVGL